MVVKLEPIKPKIDFVKNKFNYRCGLKQARFLKKSHLKLIKLHYSKLPK